MFLKAFLKTAATLVTMTPEEYYDVVREKDPYVGTIAGSAAGAAYKGYKAAKGQKSKAALIGAAAGSVGGAALGHFGGKLVRGYQAGKVHRMADELNLKSTPNKRREH